jgi:hypothetical protein
MKEMQEVERLHTVSPELVDAIKVSTDQERLILVDHACRFALEETKVKEPIVWSVFQEVLERVESADRKKEEIRKFRDSLDEQYFEKQSETPQEIEAYMTLFHTARAVSAVIEACQTDRYQATVESIYEASMSINNQQRLTSKLLQILNTLREQEKHLHSQIGFPNLYEQVFARHYESSVRAWDLERDTTIDKNAYKKALNNIVQLDRDSFTGAELYRAPSPLEAAMFLLELQRDQGFWRAEPGSVLKPGQRFKTNTFKIVFRTQTADVVPFEPLETIVKDRNRKLHDRELLAFCFLMKTITEKHVSISLQAHLWQTNAFHSALPTQLLDWTSDPAMAIYWANMQRTTGAEATVYFERFEDIDRILLPSPTAKSVFRQRAFFTAMSAEKNARLLRKASRITFPVGKFSLPKSFPSFSSPSHLDQLAVEVANRAQEIAQDPSIDLDGLVTASDIGSKMRAVSHLRNQLSQTIERLSRQYDFSREWWDDSIRNWILEIDNYFHDLLGFTNSADNLLLAEPSLFKLADLNTDALNIYLSYIMSRSGPGFDERKPQLMKLADQIKRTKQSRYRTFIKPPMSSFIASDSLPKSLISEKPDLVNEIVSEEDKLIAVAEDSQVLCAL